MKINYKCIENNCKKDSYARGLCRLHYYCYYKSGDLNRTEEDIGRILEELLSLTTPHADLNGVNIYLTMPGGCPQILVDRDKLKQAFLNIIINAVDVMSGSGGDINIKVSKEDGYLNVSIKDTGPGIPEDQLAHIFEEFHRFQHGQIPPCLPSAMRSQRRRLPQSRQFSLPFP